MLASTALFAVGNTIVKYLSVFEAFQLVFFRSVVSIVISYGQIKRLKLPLFGVNKKILLLRGLSGTIALFLFFELIKNVNLSTAVTLQYLSPIFTSLIAIWLLKEKIIKWQWLSLIVCFIGVAFLQKGDIYLDNFYIALGILSAALSGLAYNCIRISRTTDHPIHSVFYFPLVAIPISLIFSIPHWVNPNFHQILLLLLLGLLTQIAQVFMSKALQMDTAAKVSIYHYLGSIFAVIIGIFLFDEIPNWKMIMGILIIITSLILFNRLAPRKS